MQERKRVLSRDQLLRVIFSLERALADDDNEDHVRRRLAGQYFYIPLGLEHFSMQLKAALEFTGYNICRYGTLRFIDVGCGIGTKLLAVQTLAPALLVEGVEIEPKYARAAERVVGSAGTIHERDALRFDYKHYDIIYFYRPLSKQELQGQLERRIVETAKPGAIIIANGWVDPVFTSPAVKDLGKKLEGSPLSSSGILFQKV